MRLLAATNRTSERAIAAGTFREDLYYRLNVFDSVPPRCASERRPAAATRRPLPRESCRPKHHPEHQAFRRQPSTCSRAITGRVTCELQNTPERAVLVCDGQVIHGHHLPPSLQTAPRLQER